MKISTLHNSTKLQKYLLKGAISSLAFLLAFPLQASETKEFKLNEEEVKGLEQQLKTLQLSSKQEDFPLFPDESKCMTTFASYMSPSLEEKASSSEEVIKKSLGLSIDGGGIRGFMAALWLENLEEEVQDQHKVQLHRIFDYMGGTSIGGILSLGLAHGIPAQELVKMFDDEHQRQKIFPKGKSSWKIVENVKNTLNNTLHWFSTRYDSSPLESLLKEKFGEEATLDTVKTNILVTACTVQGAPFLFENRGRFLKKNKEGNYYKLWEVARSTSAAPTYFEAYPLDEGISLVDGGLWANNPSMLIAGRMIKKWSADDIGLLSLGTGIVPASGSIPINTGKFTAIEPTLNALMNSQNLGNHLALTEFLGENYSRVNPELTENIELDVTHLSAIQSLKKAAEGQRYKVMKFYKNNKETIRHILERNKE